MTRLSNNGHGFTHTNGKSATKGRGNTDAMDVPSCQDLSSLAQQYADNQASGNVQDTSGDYSDDSPNELMSDLAAGESMVIGDGDFE